MSLSAHRRMAVAEATKIGPDSVRQLDGLVILRYADVPVHVRKRDWRVHMPFDQEDAAWREGLGVCEHAQQAVARGEGIDPPRDYSMTPGRQALNEALEQMRRALR